MVGKGGGGKEGEVKDMFLEHICRLGRGGDEGGGGNEGGGGEERFKGRSPNSHIKRSKAESELSYIKAV